LGRKLRKSSSSSRVCQKADEVLHKRVEVLTSSNAEDTPLPHER